MRYDKVSAWVLYVFIAMWALIGIGWLICMTFWIDGCSYLGVG